MCGIAGILSVGAGAGPVNPAELERLGRALAARGPDGHGQWVAPDARAGLVHRRLAVIDPGPGGHQPMATPDGRLRIVFNGEIYNHKELRAALRAAGAAIRSASDTEILLHLYDRHGPAMVERLEGMYAFALWDEARRGLFLARDPFGIKPLYVSETGGTLRFASQVTALAGLPAMDRTLEPAAVVGFLTLGSVPEPLTIYRHIRSLPAGAFLWIAADGERREGTHFAPGAVLGEAEAGPPAAAAPEARRALLRDAVAASLRRHLVADVPVGLFLSGGVDSGALLAFASAEAGRGLPAITLAFAEYAGTPEDEAPVARRVADLHGAAHHVDIVPGDRFGTDAERVLDAMDQPSTDGVNTWLVSRAAAARGLKVMLSGVGGDELLGGYPGFRQVPRLARTLAPFGRWPVLGRASRRLAAPLASRLTSPKYASLLEFGTTVPDAWLLRRALFLPWELPAVLDPALAADGWEALALRDRLASRVAGLPTPHAQVMLLELEVYMRNQLLRDADWAGMAHGVEIRTPLVDRTLFVTLAPLLAAPRPPDKADLLAAAGPGLGAILAGRPKTGFGVPVGRWLATGGQPRDRGLRGWARRILTRLPDAPAWLAPARRGF